MKKRRWIFRALGVFLAIVAVTLAAAIVLNSAAAESLPFSLGLRSKLTADYSQDGSQGVLGVFRLSIIGDALRDLGLTSKEADEQTAGIKIALNDPVPTATALNFEGDDPYTPTPTSTPTPTVTNTPTNTPRPTKTPIPTSTKKPATAVPAATATASGPVDNTKPTICCMTLAPTPGVSTPGAPLTSCTIDVVDLQVFDPTFSSGVSDSNVQLKYRSASVGWTPVSLNLITGGWVSGPGSDWDAHYGKIITLSGVKSGEVIEVEGRVEDNAGTGWRYTSIYYYDYTGPDC